MKRGRVIIAMVALSLFVTAMPVAAEKKQKEKAANTSAEWAGKDKGLGHIPEKKEIFNKKDLVDDQVPSGSKNRKKAEALLPSSYDARTEGVVPSVKDQGYTSNCWAFAALGSGESGLMKEGEAEPDLSERHLAYTSFHYWIDPLNLTEGDKRQLEEGVNSYDMGANSYIACNTLAAWRGAVDEEKAPFDVVMDADVDERQEGIRIPDSMTFQQDSYHLENTEFVYLATPNRVKKMLMEKGCSVISYHAPDTAEEEARYANKEYTAYYVDDGDLIENHDVLLVGWDDDYPVANFNPKCRPKKPGAWLIRNSWGPGEHEGGYLWISYEDAVLAREAMEVAFFDLRSADNYDNNYQYDGGSDTLFQSGAAMGIDRIANIFTAQYKESLEAVSIQTGERNVDYDIKIYEVENDTEPESGELLTTLTGTLEERGYHTIDFTEQGKKDIALEKGEKFSVVVRLTNEDGECSIITQETTTGWAGVIDKVFLNEKQSFVLGTDSDQWDDCTAYPELFQGNWRIKAFTSVDNSVLCDGITAGQESVTVRENEKEVIPYTLSPENVTNEIVTWESADENVARVSNGVVYGISGGKTTITGRINGHEMTVSVTVESIPAESISLPQSITLYRNQSQKLEAEIVPADTTDVLKWESQDPSKVWVYDDGTVVGLQETGKDGVVVEATAGSCTARCLVIVTAKSPQDVTLGEMQSQHPYLGGMTQTFEYARDNAVSYRVTFSEDTALEDEFDFLYLYDDNNEIAAAYTGWELAGETITVPYSRVKLELVADEGVEYYGFRITDITPEYKTLLPTPTATPSVTQTPGTADQTYQVTMVTGISDPRVYTVKAGEKAYPLDGGPGRAGYEFLGWYNGNVKYNFNTPVQSNLTLTAKWKKVTVKKSSVKNVKKKGKKITITVKKVAGVVGYQVKAGSNKKVTKNKRTLSGKKNKFVIKKWKKKNCYVKVRAYKLDSTGRKVYGKWSSTVVLAKKAK